MSFYVTLPSTGGLSENNTQSEYTTILSEAIDLYENYEVALVDISYSSVISFNMGKLLLDNFMEYFFEIYDDNLKIIKINLDFNNGVVRKDFIQNINEKIDHAILKAAYQNIQYLAFEKLPLDLIDVSNRLVTFSVFQENKLIDAFVIDNNNLYTIVYHFILKNQIRTNINKLVTKVLTVEWHSEPFSLNLE